jgi:hypothetical protein
MGTVYRGSVRASGDPVAIKLIAARGDSAPARFEREAEVLSQLSHPGIVRYVAHGTTGDGSAYLVMEWLDGIELERRLTDSGLTPQASLDLIRRVADALGYAHERGVIHRDLKPSNLFLVGGQVERVKILDFGVARLLGGTSVTRTGAVVGTAAYMAPEQARGSNDIGPPTDIFALGCVLFKCLTGRSPFVAAHPLAMMSQIIFQEAPRLRDVRPELPPSLDELVAAMLAKDPADRPADVRDLIHRIDTLGSFVGAAAISGDSRPSLGLTDTERRLMCVVLVADALYDAGSDTRAVRRGDDTLDDDGPDELIDGALTLENDDARLAALCGEVQRYDGQAAPLASGSLIGVFMADGAATDLAARTAECALALRTVVPAAPIAIATGREVFGGNLPVGDLIERQVEMLRASGRAEAVGTGAQPIRLDPVTAGLLDPRFQVSVDASGTHLLWRQQEMTARPRTLLGQETDCVGRERELSLMQEILEECVDEPVARAVMITGPAGIGKSRLRYELLRWLDDDDARRVEVWSAHAHSVGRPNELDLLGAALRHAVGIMDSDPEATRRRKIRNRVGHHFKRAERQRIADAVGAIAGVYFPGASVAPPAIGEPAVDPALATALVDFVRAECATQPVLLLLEDVHWSDRASVRLVDGLLRALREAPLMVLATARPTVHQRFPGLWFDRGVEEIRLHALRRSTCNRYVKSLLGADTPRELVRQLVQQSGGNAFFLEELVRAHAEGAGEMPETLLAMVQARLERFPSRVRRVLRAASVFGVEFQLAGVLAVLDEEAGGEADIAQWLELLEEQEVIARHPSRDAYLFVHAYMRDAAYEMLTEGDRVRAEQAAERWRERADASS